MAQIQIITASFRREHGREPGRSDDGLWAVQQTVSDLALDQHLEGEILWYQGKIGGLRKWLEGQGLSGMWAILP